jgi:hypothetical protein
VARQRERGRRLEREYKSNFENFKMCERKCPHTWIYLTSSIQHLSECYKRSLTTLCSWWTRWTSVCLCYVMCECVLYIYIWKPVHKRGGGTESFLILLNSDYKALFPTFQGEYLFIFLNMAAASHHWLCVMPVCTFFLSGQPHRFIVSRLSFSLL